MILLLFLTGSQKVLSCFADMSVVFVSSRAWTVAEQVNYVGYDALVPFKNALQSKYFPYTPNWHGIVLGYHCICLHFVN